VADDRRGGEHVDRLGQQRAERGDRQPQDLAVVGASSCDQTGSLARSRDA
jgi:hypothetical protein